MIASRKDQDWILSHSGSSFEGRGYLLEASYHPANYLPITKGETYIYKEMIWWSQSLKSGEITVIVILL